MTPAISIMMPVYNGERFLREAIDSILTQSFTDWEFIIINDGSTDNTDTIVQSYTDDKRIHYYENDGNHGYAWTCNRGFSLCKGRYIALQDADDVSMEERLEKEYAALEANPDCFIAFSKSTFINNEGAVQNDWGGVGNESRVLDNSKYFYDLYTIGNFIPNPTVMIRVLNDLEPHYNEELPVCNDFDYHIRMLNRFNFYYISEPLVKMRRDDNHLTMTSNKDINYRTERKILRQNYHFLRQSDGLAVTLLTYLRAMSNQYLKESLYYRKHRFLFKEIMRLLCSYLYFPANKRFYEHVIRTYISDDFYFFLRNLIKS